MRSTFEDLRRDAAYGLRLLARNRGFTVVSALTLALGIGATSAIFSVLNAVVLAPLPFRDPGRLVWAQMVNGEGRTRGIPLDVTDAWREGSKTVTGVAHALMGQANFTVTGPGGAERVLLEQVDFYTLPLLGVQPLIGRWFQPDEVIVQGNTSQTIVISYGMWQRIFGGDPNVVGKKLPALRPDGEIVIGVMPRGSTSTRRGPTAMAGIHHPKPRADARASRRRQPTQAQAELADRPGPAASGSRPYGGQHLANRSSLFTEAIGTATPGPCMLLGAVGLSC